MAFDSYFSTLFSYSLMGATAAAYLKLNPDGAFDAGSSSGATAVIDGRMEALWRGGDGVLATGVGNHCGLSPCLYLAITTNREFCFSGSK